MAKFEYQARNIDLKKVDGSIVAKNQKEARLMLRNDGLTPISVKQVKETTSEKKGLMTMEINIFKPKVKLKELTLFTRQFATLIGAHINIAKALSMLSDNVTNKAFKKILQQITRDIERGTSLSNALAKYPSIFSNIYVDMVESAEVGGNLDVVLNRLAKYLEDDKALKAKVKNAFIYPTVVSVIAIAAVMVLLIFVIPKFMILFEDLGEDLPVPTKMLLNLSAFLQNYWWAIILFIIILIVGINIYGRTYIGRRHLDYIKLKLPIFGQITTKTAIARFCRTLETLENSGVPLIQSISIVGRTSGNTVIEDALKKSLISIENGGKLYEPLEKSSAFPKMVTQMISIGEESGELEALLSKIADFYEEEVDMAVKSLTALIEPIITVILGVGIGFIAIAVITPMYGMMTALQNNM